MPARFGRRERLLTALALALAGIAFEYVVSAPRRAELGAWAQSIFLGTLLFLVMGGRDRAFFTGVYCALLSGSLAMLAAFTSVKTMKRFPAPADWPSELPVLGWALLGVGLSVAVPVAFTWGVTRLIRFLEARFGRSQPRPPAFPGPRCLLLALLLAWPGATPGRVAGAERELIQDNAFQRGFVLWEPKPGRHVRYGLLPGAISNAAPVWGLSQWSSRFPLNPALAVRSGDGLICSNGAKVVAWSGTNGLTLAVNSRVEYGPVARAAADPWTHLLVEQEFTPPAPLADLASARLHVEARLRYATNLHEGDYSADRHAAQFQIFFTVQNRARGSAAHGDLLWFGVPLYDNRARFPREYKARDFGGTGKFIFTPGGETFAPRSAHDGEWVVIDTDLLPRMREALEVAWARGFLGGSRRLEDYHIGGMNMGWEVPGSFAVEMQVRALSLKVTTRDE